MEFLERQDCFVAAVAVLMRGHRVSHHPSCPARLGRRGWGWVSLFRWWARTGLPSPVCPSVRPSAGACGVSQAVNSRKLPGRHMEGAGWGRARARSQQMCLQGRGAGRRSTNLAFKDICLFTIKAGSRRRADGAVFMRHRRRLEGHLPVAPHTERERGLDFISGPGGGKRN